MVVVYTNLKLLGELFSYLDSKVPAKLLETENTLTICPLWVALFKDGISLSSQRGQLNVLQNPTVPICYRASKALSCWGRRSGGRETRMVSGRDGEESTRQEEKQTVTGERR